MPTETVACLPPERNEKDFSLLPRVASLLVPKKGGHVLTLLESLRKTPSRTAGCQHWLRKPQNWRRKVHAETCCVQPAATSHVVLEQDCSRLLAERRKCNKICCVIFVTDKTLMQNKVINISYYLCCCAIYTIGSSQRWYFCFVRDQSSISWKHECHESWSGDQQILLHSQKASQLATETRIKNTLE